jgi:hypothetical protein
MGKERAFYARQDESKNPAAFLGHACYAFRVVELECQFSPGEGDILGKADLINPIQFFEISCPKIAYLYGLSGHAAIILHHVEALLPAERILRERLG